MNSAKIQQLLKIDPIRPPKSDNHRRSRSTLSTKTLSQTCSLQSQQQDTGCYPISTSSSIKFLQCNLIQIQTTEDCDPGEDERVSVTLPKSHLNSSIQENKNIYSYTKSLVNQVLSPRTFNKKKTPVIPKRVTKERRPLMDSISNISTPAVKYCDRTITFGLKVQDQSNASTESFDKENITSTKPLNAKDKKSKEQIKQVEPANIKTELAFTFETEDGKGTNNSSEDSSDNKGRYHNIQDNHEENIAPQTPQKTIDVVRGLSNSRQLSHSLLPSYLSNPKHQRKTSDFTQDRFFSRRERSHSRQRSHLITPERSMMEERFDNVPTKEFYSGLLKEMEKTPISLEEDGHILQVLKKASKGDQTAFDILQTKFGSRYSQGLFYVFIKSIKDTDMSNSKMSYNKFLAFMKSFELFNQQVTKEMVSITFARRCPNKTIDFAAFIDILFKISKTQFLPKGYNVSCETRFQVYLDLNILNKHLQILDKPREHKTPRFPFFCHHGKEERVAAVLLEQNNELLNHIFSLYESLDIQYHNKPIITFKDFKKFCYDYTIVPVLCNLGEVVEVFKKFQIETKPVINFQGFVSCLISFANTGFGKESLKGRYETFDKKLHKFFEIIGDMNQRLCDQMVLKHISRPKK